MRNHESAFTLSQVKVLPLHCACLLAICTQLVACGGADPLEPNPPPTSAAPKTAFSDSADDDSSAAKAHSADADADATDGATHADCLDLEQEPISCGQISLTLKGAGSSCQLTPTANDLTRPPRDVRFDCNAIQRGPNGYDYDSLGHITLTGDTCAALQKGGPHRVTLILGCPPS
ncbi:MAG TPA: hypothetical protein VFK05_38400 [Polyangiaceae bacterium]|nr:hypothetical protein [Polyangiaceae bacterium]